MKKTKTQPKKNQPKTMINVRTGVSKTTKELVTKITIDPHVSVATRDRYICFWSEGREVRIGPITPQQAEDLAGDLVFDAV